MEVIENVKTDRQIERGETLDQNDYESFKSIYINSGFHTKLERVSSCEIRVLEVTDRKKDRRTQSKER